MHSTCRQLWILKGLHFVGSTWTIGDWKGFDMILRKNMSIILKIFGQKGGSCQMTLICFTLSNIGSFSFNLFMQDDPNYFKTFCHLTSLKGGKLSYGHKKNYCRDNIEPNKLHHKSCCWDITWVWHHFCSYKWMANYQIRNFFWEI